MKQCIPYLFAAGLVPLATAAMAEDFSAHAYVNTDLGAAFEQEIRVRGGGDLINFHNGVRGDVAVGYQATAWLAAELGTGAIWNSADKIGNATFTSFGGSLDLYQIPVMGSLVVSTPAWHGFKPYVGAGFGGVDTVIDFQRPLGNIRDNDFTFSYQIMAGLNYEFGKRIKVGVGYKYLQTDDHNWIEHGVTLRTDGTATHSLVASFIWSF